MILRAFIILLLLTSCVDPISFDSNKQKEPSLIVSGFVSDEDEQYTVILTRAANFSGVLEEGGFNERETEALVKILDQNGRELILSETKSNSGIYKSPVVDGWNGEIGNKYHVFIKTKDGEEYQSQPEVIRASAPIDRVYYVYETHQSLNEFNNVVNKKGFQYYADINFEDKNSYYMYEWDGSYMLKTPLRRAAPDPPPILPDLRICYISEKGDLIFDLLAGNEFNNQSIKGHNLNFMRLDIRYNIKFSYNLKQYALGEDAHTFFKSLKDQLNSTGSIFDPIPAKINGNVYNINNKDEIVLGYFGAYGVASKRIFIDSTDLPADFIKGQLDQCFLQIFPPGGPPEYCYDCTFFPGSSPLKPDFWE